MHSLPAHNPRSVHLKHILLVEDDPFVIAKSTYLIKAAGFSLTVVGSVDDVLNLIQQQYSSRMQVDLIVAESCCQDISLFERIVTKSQTPLLMVVDKINRALIDFIACNQRVKVILKSYSDNDFILLIKKMLQGSQ